MQRRIVWPLVAVFLLLTVGLSSLAGIFYTLQGRHARVFIESHLSTVAGLKASQVMERRKGLLAMAETILGNRFFAARVGRLAKGPASDEAKAQVLEGLANLRHNFPYETAVITLEDGTELVAFPEGTAFTHSSDSLRLGDEARLAKRALLSSVYQDAEGRRLLEVVIPLAPDDESSPAAAATLHIAFDAAVTLDPLLEWQTPSRSSEALLIEKRENEFVHLTKPRLFDGRGLPGPLPVPSFRRPASREALGEEGIVEGPDYRGRPVIAFIKSVPESPWFVVAKLDQDELTAGMRRAFWTLMAVAATIVVFCGTLLFLFWRRSLAAEEAREKARFDQANAAMDDFIRLMINIMPNPAFVKDAQGVYKGTNSAFEKLLGRSKSEIIGKTIVDVAAPDIAAEHQQHDRALLEKPGHQIYEARLQASDGIHHVVFIKTTYRRPDGSLGGIIGILKDITQRLRAEEEIEQLRQFSESTVQTMTEGLVLTDAEGRFTFVNPAAAKMLGYTPSEMVEQEVLSFIPKDQHAIVRRADEKRAKGVADRYELDFLHKDGSRRTLLVSGGPRIQGASFAGTMAVLTDITERKRMEEEIKALSLRDELTTLYNRRGFMTLADQQLKMATRLKKKVVLLYLDVDNLKRINDTGGHKTGDRALVEIAFILKKSFRESDIVGRLGGDEFSVLAMETTRINAEVLTKRIEEKLEMFNSRSSAEAGFTLAVSVGAFTRDPEYPTSVEEMLSRADLLMYEQKRAKKGAEAGKPPGPSK